MARWSIHALLRPGLYELMAPSALLSKASAWCRASPAADLSGYNQGKRLRGWLWSRTYHDAHSAWATALCRTSSGT